MNMLKHIYKGVLGVLLIGLAACSSEQLEEDSLIQGTTPIILKGAVTRSGETTSANSNLDGYTNLFLSAKVTDDATKDFFKNIAITGITTNGADKNKSDLKAKMYYPLNKETKINLFGHTGQVDSSGNIRLTSGATPANDALISNGTDGNGTTGSANNEVKLLTFRHVMTKVEVAIEMNGDVETPQPTNIKIKFGTKVPQTGKYALTTNPVDGSNNKSTNNSGSYELNVGTHYLVPTGENLTGANTLTSLKIDDYTATKEDIATITIPQANNSGTMSDLVLKPGLAYKLTFEIKRLKVVGIKLTMQDWDIKTGNGDWGYEPHTVKMNVTGGYDNKDDKLINKIVLKYTNAGSTYQYIGSCEMAGSDVNAKFLTLPADLSTGTLAADLYTKNGLLIEGHSVVYNESSVAFDISLGANGMTKDQTGTYYEVSTPLQFYNMMSNPEANTKYQLTKNIDVNSLPLTITPPVFPSGAELDGNGKSILHLTLKGSGLFKENKGTLKNIHNAFCSIDASESNDTYVGGICSINNGAIEGCINEADIKAKDNQIVGGICGKNEADKTILACLNTGNIPTGAKIGGICGENASTAENAIKACINAGMLHGSSDHGTTTAAVGGICGYQSAQSDNKVISSSFWLTGTASHNQEYNDEAVIGSFAEGINESAQSGYSCQYTTNMTETKLRTEAVKKLNDALGSSAWKFEWKKNNGTYITVWPIPVKNTPAP